MQTFSPPTSGFYIVPQSSPPSYSSFQEDAPAAQTHHDFAGPAICEQEIFDFPIKGKQGMSVAEKWRAADLTTPIKPKAIFIGLATLVLLLLLVVPCWNCIGLLQDPTFTYMAGSQVTGWLLACCAIFIVVCYISLLVFFNRSLPSNRNENTMLMIAGIFLSTLGILLVLFGGPIKNSAEIAIREFASTDTCRTGAHSKELWTAQEELQSLRAMPNCKNKVSIEDCLGYSQYPKIKEATVLQYMESHLMCSGFCEGEDAKGNLIYPPTLFSQANYKVSCNGMASRRMKLFALGIGEQLLGQGCVLLGTAILISLGQLLHFCGKSSNPDQAKSGKSYGATL